MNLKLFCKLAAILSVALGLSGCWDNKEMDEYGYVQGVAIDATPDGKFALETLFYNPTNAQSTGGSSKPSEKRGLTIQTKGESLFEAVREIPMKLGRKAKWDHMRVILLGERLLKSHDAGEILDFFSRDHEPRGTVLPIVAQSDAGRFLEIKPLIEETIGQQFKRMETEGAHYSAKTSGIPLYDLAIHLKSPARVAIIPFLHQDETDKKAILSGLAILKKGKLAGILDSKETATFMMLDNRYRIGILTIPCQGAGSPQIGTAESLEVLSFSNKMKVSFDEVGRVHVGMKIRIRGTAGELQCSKLDSPKETKRFEEQVSDMVEEQLQHTVSILQQYESDALGIGNRIASRHPKKWRQMESSWDKSFAKCRFRFDVETEIVGTGMDIGTPFSQEED
ncbi:Ger(x)C family spore germination protein [Cohnella hashimotonis]|uniref:Ger(X)C family spore germination protein n=1 Tax=Cohnella hashimotonis TaxID=2826895 RepID=A0ABT6TH64_9BACL|nr:Ger(x)C family spore germination protein [Cohnella hashimotonis]MDI4645177.1 Ger(x)C family spore germination protein [Cohnella hashimotonis]